MASVLRAHALEPSQYGLVNPKTLVAESERWVSGFDQESNACNATVTLLSACNPGVSGIPQTVIEKTGESSIGPYLPFTIEAKVNCSTIGGLRVDWEQRALNALEACRGKAVEIEFWEGRLTRAENADDPGSNLNRYLANGEAIDVTPTPGTAIKARYGLARLEGALASAGCGGRGFIHTPVSVASVLPLKDRNSEGILTTTLGNYVISGDGYTGTGTDGAAPPGSSVWLYATGPVFVRLDDPTVIDLDMRRVINTETNEIVVAAEQAAAVVWDGCAHFKVLVDLALDYA